MNNPFETIDARLSNIENLLLDIKHSEKAVMPTEKIYLTRKEAASKLNISLPTLSSHSKSGLIKSHRIGGRVVYKSAELNEALSMVQTTNKKS